MNSLKPRCLGKNKVVGHSAGGWICPCCWTDPNTKPITNETLDALFTEELKIENNDTIEDILNSEQWFDFVAMLKGPYEKVPEICKIHCTTQQLARIKS